MLDKILNLPHLKSYFPGLLCCLTIAAAAQFLSEHYSAPQMLFALLLGLAFHFLSETENCSPGIEFSATILLKTGVALLGFRITLEQVTSLGAENITIVISAVIATILFGVALSYVLGRRFRFGILTGGAVAICGASAALAISSILPKTPTRERDTIFTVVAVTTLSTMAMIIYPILVNTIGLSDEVSGLFLGATIHDVAQVVGAGYSVSEQSGDVATVIKLFRVALLVPIVLLFTIMFAKDGEGFSLSIIPIFIIGFSLAVTVNSFGILPAELTQFLSDASSWLLVTGIVAIGIKTSLKSMTNVGYTAFIIIAAETLFIALWVMLGLYMAGKL